MKKYIKLTTLAALLATLLSFGSNLAAPVYADEGEEESLPATWLQLSPTAVTVTLEGGDVLSGNAQKCPSELEAGCALEIKNIGSESFRYKAYPAPYNVVGENNEVDFSENSTNQYSQLSRWITLLQPDTGEYQKEIIGEIAPGETQTLYYRIDVPDDVPGGAQYAVIFVQTLSDPSSSSTSIQTISQAGMVLSGRSIGDVRQTAEVTEYGFQRFAFGGSLNAKATIKNTGNTDFSAYYYYTARTLFGKELYEDKGLLAAYPGNEYHINVDWDNIPFLGIFTVEFKISAADTVKTETHIVVIMPVFVMVLLILLLTIIIVWIIIIIRKRKERKARTLV